MFHAIPDPIKERMEYLEEIDIRDRVDGTPKSHRMRQIPSETGRFLALLLANAPQGQVLEIGTSAGYSTLWLSLACRINGRTLTTFEISEYKTRMARATFRRAQIEDVVNLVQGNAVTQLEKYQEVAFCFLDTEKELYEACYKAIIPKLVSGGLLVADNATSHQAELQPVIDRSLNDFRVDAVVVPIGKGLLVNRKV
jgi:caffeoyl-CoA O-methyltransferase